MPLNLKTDRFVVIITDDTVPILVKTYELDKEDFDLCLDMAPATFYFVDEQGAGRILDEKAFNEEYTTVERREDALTFVARRNKK